MSPVVFAAGFLSFGAVFSLPMLAFVSWGELQPSTASVLNLIGLGLGPSAIASLIYPILVNRAGPTFLSLTGYVIPILAAIIGWVIYREVLSWNAYVAFGLIIAGVYVSQQAMRPKRLASQAE
ncbi:MAG: DMT family transporter [Pseudomonadota bacterium]